MYWPVFHTGFLQEIAARSDGPRDNRILAAASCDLESHPLGAQHIRHRNQIKWLGDFMSRLPKRCVLVLIVSGMFPVLHVLRGL